MKNYLTIIFDFKTLSITTVSSSSGNLYVIDFHTSCPVRYVPRLCIRPRSYDSPVFYMIADIEQSLRDYLKSRMLP